MEPTFKYMVKGLDGTLYGDAYDEPNKAIQEYLYDIEGFGYWRGRYSYQRRETPFGEMLKAYEEFKKSGLKVTKVQLVEVPWEQT